jgi:hypothetical protein
LKELAQKQPSLAIVDSQVDSIIATWPVGYPHHLEWSYRWAGDAAWVGECINDETNQEGKFAARLSGPLQSLRVVWDGNSPHLPWCISNALVKVDAAPDALPLVLIIEFDGSAEDSGVFGCTPGLNEYEFVRAILDALLARMVWAVQLEGKRDLGELVLVVTEGADWGWLEQTSRMCADWGVRLSARTRAQLIVGRAPAWVHS